MLVVFATALTENIMEWENILVGGGAFLAALGFPKLARTLKNIKLRRLFQRADKVLENASVLSTQTISEAVKEGLTAGLADFQANQKTRDDESWKAHTSCHNQINKRLDSIDKHAVERAKDIKKIAKDVTYIKGHLKIEQD